MVIPLCVSGTGSRPAVDVKSQVPWPHALGTPACTWLKSPDTAISHYCSTEAVADPHGFYACYFFLSIFIVWLVDLPMESLGWRTEGKQLR